MFKFFIITMLSLLLLTCGNTSNAVKNNFSIKTNAKNNSVAIGETLNLSIKNPNKKAITSVTYKIDGKNVSDSFVVENLKLGVHNLTATIHYNDASEEKSTKITILNNNPPKIYTYKIVNEYPHDITSYTQGLEFYNGDLYESTGQYGESKLRKVDYKTGNIIQNVNLTRQYFGEGLTVLNDKIYQLTWQENTGFVYDVNSLEKTGSFKYGQSKEGWGICNDGRQLYKSDGTENIWLLNPDTQAEESKIQAYTNKGKIIGLNEMEWVNGKIYVNRYQKNGVAIINPVNGAIEGVIDFSPLKKLVTQHQGLDVLNGIAYNPETKTVFVTGKRWDKVFEVEITEK
ncbi:glutaminyl-peptide cyclotransferase [Ichthyenterobacterium magnum]|uniref:Glutamine cyclotransferase n=1 Tax=Ichthyenterobacterium magnum TaxID=1230530 RepID=A0A420DLP3_9FLAO|nr:glutaminyl-peptide cyclotransferase [Ichthyenterobacterium magnum]RKE95121.1 glutamine cyclotransferase [Ichthyenterobacterium magnum]